MLNVNKLFIGLFVTSIETNTFAKACDKVSELVHALRTRFNGIRTSHAKIPGFISEPSRRVIIGLARLPVANSFARIPPVVWKLGWMPPTEGAFGTELPPLPVDILKEKDVLKEFVLRVNSIGMSFLVILSIMFICD